MTNNLYTLNPVEITMYVTQNCSDCRMAKAYFEANEIPFVQVNLEGDDQATEFVQRINRGYQSVPTIIFPDGSLLVEPSIKELKNKFAAS